MALVCKSIRETHEPKQIPTDAAEELEKETIVEPPETRWGQTTPSMLH